MDLLEKVEPNLFAKEDKIWSINRTKGGLGFASKKWRKATKLLPNLLSKSENLRVSWNQEKNFAIQGEMR